MKTCPTCVGEGKVKDGVVDHSKAFWKSASKPIDLLWRGMLVLATPFVVTAALVTLVRIAHFVIGAETITPSGYDARGPLSPTAPMQLAAIIGVLGGVGFAIFLAMHLWETRKK